MNEKQNHLRVAILGATGLVGRGVLNACLDDPAVEHIITINRKAIGPAHPKLTEIVQSNLFDLSSVEDKLTGLNACFFCIGVSSVGIKEAEYNRITYQLTMHVAETLLKLNRDLCFCFVSGIGTDSSEKGRTMWARIKGKTENALLQMPFRSAFMFRPGYIQPMRGAKSRTALYNAGYVVLKPLYPLIKRLAPNSVTTNEAIGKAMINVAMNGYEQKILYPRHINFLAVD